MSLPTPGPAKPAITLLVEHHGGPSRLSRALGGRPRYQEIQRWMQRGWAASKHIFDLEAYLPPGVTLRDLHQDRVLARQAAVSDPVAAAPAPSASVPPTPHGGPAR